MRLLFVTSDHFKQLWVRLRYPKLMLLGSFFVLVYMFVTGAAFIRVHGMFFQLGYVGTFLAGMLYTYSFTTPPATGILYIIGGSQNIWIGALVGGLGAVIADLFIFKFVRATFSDEIDRLAQTRLVQVTANGMPLWLKRWLVPVLGCVIIASPLPDELGVSMLAFSTMSTRTFIFLSYVFNGLGILSILWLGSLA